MRLKGLDEEVEAMEAHERKMNFRFEEDGATEIQTYPRTIGDSVRRKDTKRQAARERAKVRKGEEKQQKQEEIARLKKIKQSEIIAKLAEIKAITGTEVEGLEGVDLEGEFDPAEHDKQMEGMFDDQYYGAGEDEGEKPEFPDDLGDIEEEYGADEEYGGEEDWFPNADDGNDDAFPDADAMDADFQQGAGAEAGAVPAPKKLSRKQLKQIEAALERGEHDEEIEKDPMLKRYMDEFYNLDYEDIVGGIPTRFKYREVLPNDFGLTVDEVLKADDQELNNWANLKRMVQFRDDTIERRDKRVYKKRRGAMTAKKTTFAKSEAWKSGIKARRTSLLLYIHVLYVYLHIYTSLFFNFFFPLPLPIFFFSAAIPKHTLVACSARPRAAPSLPSRSSARLICCDCDVLLTCAQNICV